MSWKQWVTDKCAKEILEAQIPHNVTYWIRHKKTCANGSECPHSFLAALELTQKGIQHFGHGYCFDCYHDLGLGSGAKIPGPN